MGGKVEVGRKKVEVAAECVNGAFSW